VHLYVTVSNPALLLQDPNKRLLLLLFYMLYINHTCKI